MLIAARNAILAGGAAPGPTPAYWGLCFTAGEAGATVSLKKSGRPDAISLLYSIDAEHWEPFVAGSTSVTLANVGDCVWLRAGEGGNATFSKSASSYYYFQFPKQVLGSGDIMSLLNGDERIDTVPRFCFYMSFYGCTTLLTAPELSATTLSGNCYNQMFRNCTSLTETPLLPATTIAARSYFYMFSACSSLASVTTKQTQPFGDGSIANDPNYHWMNGVAATGTFYCPKELGTNATITRGGSACPEGWTVVNTDA